MDLHGYCEKLCNLNNLFIDVHGDWNYLSNDVTYMYIGYGPLTVTVGNEGL